MSLFVKKSTPPWENPFLANAPPLLKGEEVTAQNDSLPFGLFSLL